MEDESLYNTIIIALIIGIIVVIVTLFLTKPQPESFTEIYFNNHQELPQYTNLNEVHPYSVTIANHENKDKTYNFTIKEELYRLDHTCEVKSLYLEKNNNSWETNTNDPYMYVKGENYTIQFSYAVKSGEGIITSALTNPNKTQEITTEINENTQTLTLITKTQKITKPINITKRLTHKIKINKQNTNLTIFIDDEIILNHKLENNPKGFITLKTKDTYAKIYNLEVLRNQAKQSISVRFETNTQITKSLDMKQTLKQTIITYQAPSTQDIKTEISPFIDESLFFSNKEDNLSLLDYILPEFYYTQKENNKPPQNIRYYYEADPFEIERYTMQILFRTRKEFEFGIENSINIQYTQENITAQYDNKEIDINQTPRYAWHSAVIEVNNNDARIFYDYKLVAEINDLQIQGITKPYIKTNDENLAIKNFVIESNLEPLAVSYALPIEKQETTRSTRVYDPRLLDPEGREEKPKEEQLSREILETIFEQNKIDWKSYRADIIFVDRTRQTPLLMTFNDLDQTLYSVYIDVKETTIKYLKNGELIEEITNTSLLDESSQHRMIIDVENQNITITIDTTLLLKEQIDKTSPGVLLLNHSDSLIVTRTNVENIEANEIRSYTRRIVNTCQPEIIKTKESTGQITVKNEEKSIYEGTFNFREEFDIAKIQILVDDQDIHFLVKQI